MVVQLKQQLLHQRLFQAYDNKIIDLPVFARLMGAESDKAKEMLSDTKTQMFDSVEDAINSVVLEVNKSG